MNFLARTIVGIPVSFVILIFFIGGVQDAAGFMVLSIICTAGVSLVVWIPIWYLLGWVALTIFGAATGRPESKRPTRIRTRHERDVDAVVDYMRCAEASGLSKVGIRLKLEEAGWGNAVIDEALVQLTHRAPDSQPHTG